MLKQSKHGFDNYPKATVHFVQSQQHKKAPTHLIALESKSDLGELLLQTINLPLRLLQFQYLQKPQTPLLRIPV